MKENIVQSTATPRLVINIVGEEGQPAKSWTLCVDYRALARIEEMTGIDLKKPDEWDKIKSGGTFPKIIFCCLGRYSPEVTLDEVLDCLNTQAHAALWNALFDITFPGLREEMVKYRARKTGASPKTEPESPTT